MNTMTESSAISTTTSTTQWQRLYICLITLMLASIGIKYQGLSTNPFQERRASMLIFLIAIFCHVLTGIVSMPNAILFHVSGVIACETLLWVLVSEFWWFIIINVLFSLVGALCFYYKQVSGCIDQMCTWFRDIYAKLRTRVSQEGPQPNGTADSKNESTQGDDAV